VKFNVSTSNFREAEFLLMVIEGEPTLRVGEGIIPVFPFESWIACFFILLDASKKVGEGLIQSSQHVLKYLRMNHLQKLVGLFSVFQLICLLSIGNRFFASCPCIFPLGKTVVVQQTTGSKPLR